MRKTIYIAGAYRAPSAWKIEQNVRKSEEVFLKLCREGWSPISPHTMTRFMQHEEPDDFWLDVCMGYLVVVDAIYMMKGWESSGGSRQEHEFAKELELEVIYE